MAVSSYGVGSARIIRSVRITLGLVLRYQGRDLIIVEDNIDSGIRLRRHRMLSCGTQSICICHPLDKFERREVDVRCA